MRTVFSKFTAVLTAAALFCGGLPVCELHADEEIYALTEIEEINREGDLILDITTDELRELGFSVGDEVRVELKKYDKKYDVPVFVTDSDSETGQIALIDDEDFAALSIAKGSFAQQTGLFVNQPGPEDDFLWVEKKGGDEPEGEVQITLLERGSYFKQYELRNPERTNDRDDYSSDAKFANFRNVTVGTISEDVLYRSSSPINNILNRAKYASKKMEKAGIRTVINLSDKEKDAAKYLKKKKNAYYSKLFNEGSVLCLGLGFDFKSEKFKKGIGEAVRFMASHEAPYLIHCTEGKDRTGFLVAVIESLMGASVSQMTSDYMLTYRNFFGFDDDSEEFEYTKKNYLKEVLRSIAGVEKNSDLKRLDYHQAAVDFLLDAGVSEEEIDALVKKLSDPAPEYREVPELTVDVSMTDKKGLADLGEHPECGGVYSGMAIKPGEFSMIINGAYMYNERDYKVSYKQNRHAGRMQVTVHLDEKTELYKDGIKKLRFYAQIAPKELKEEDVRVKINKKGTGIRFIKDLEREANIKKEYYTVDMDARKVVFNGDYSGEISF
jgi:protein tyrosine/serine phosphatase